MVDLEANNVATEYQQYGYNPRFLCPGYIFPALFLITFFVLFVTFSPIDVTSKEENNARIDWHLTTCCDEQTRLFLFMFAGYFIINYALWNTVILKPMKLCAVFLHELSHATACWITGGRVGKIQVDLDEGGITHYSGGLKTFIVPAGYLGCALWGGLLVAASGSRLGSTFASGLFMSVLILTLAYSPNTIVIVLSLSFTVLTGVCIFLEWYVFDFLFLPYVTLYYGVFIGWYSLKDIYDDCVSRDLDESDAQECHKMYPICLPRLVGVQFAVVAILFQIFGLYVALVLIESTY